MNVYGRITQKLNMIRSYRYIGLLQFEIEDYTESFSEDLSMRI